MVSEGIGSSMKPCEWVIEGGIRIVPAYTDYLSSIELEGRHDIPELKLLVNSLLVFRDAMYSHIRKCFPRYISTEPQYNPTIKPPPSTVTRTTPSTVLTYR